MNKLVQFVQNFILNWEGIMEKMSYERRVYESVGAYLKQCLDNWWERKPIHMLALFF